MRRLIATTIVAAALAIGTQTPAAAHHQQGPCTGYRVGAYDVAPYRRAAVSIARTKALAYCLWKRLTPALSWSEFVWIAEHESGWRRLAYNAGGCGGWGCGGLLQHHLRYWPGRADALPRLWFPHTYPNVRWGNARANLVAGIRMMQTRSGVCGGWTIC